MLNSEVTKTIMSSETSNVIQFYKFDFYEWIIFIGETIYYADKNTELVRYFGTSIYFGTSLTSKILKLNSEVVHRSIYQDILPDDI